MFLDVFWIYLDMIFFTIKGKYLFDFAWTFEPLASGKILELSWQIPHYIWEIE